MDDEQRRQGIANVIIVAGLAKADEQIQIQIVEVRILIRHS